MTSFILTLLLSLAPAFANERKTEKADQVLVLAVDSSGSIEILGDERDPGAIDEFKLQKDGILWALKHPDVRDALARCQVAVQYMEWAGPEEQKVVVDWALLKKPEDIDRFAAAIEAAPREYRGYTDILSALEFAGNEVEKGAERFHASKKTIDISSDGEQDAGPGLRSREADIQRLHDQRADFIARDITVNALVIEDLPPPGGKNWFPDLLGYYRDNVIAGPDSFAVPTADFEGYGEALRKKLIREVCNVVM